MYTLLPLTSVLSMYFFMKFIREEKRNYLVGYALATIACLYTHNYGFFLLPAQVLMLLYPPSKPRTWIAWLISIGCIGLVYAFWLPIFLFQLRNGTHYAWIRFFWNRHGFWGSLLNTLQSFSPGGTQLPYVPLNELSWNPLLPVVFMVILLLFGIIQFIIRRQTIFYWLLLYLLVPLIIAGLFSLVSLPIYLAGRCDQLVFPAFCLFLAVSIHSIRPKGLQYGAIIVLMVFSFGTLNDYYRISIKSGDRKIASTIKGNLRPGDAIVCTSFTRASLEYYLREDKKRIRLFSYPREMANHLGNQDRKTLLKDPEKLIREAKLLEKEIRMGGSQSGRLFLLYVPNKVNNFLWSQLEENVPAHQIRSMGEFKQSLLNPLVEIFLINFRGDVYNQAGEV